MNATSQMVQNGTFPLPSFWQVARWIWPKLTTKKLEAAAGVPRGTAKNWVEGRGEPRAEDILRIALNDPEACQRFRDILDQLDNQRSAIRAGLAKLETTRPAVARAAMDSAKRVGARPRASVPQGVVGAVGK